MRIEHIALWVNDLERTCAFYVKFFNATSGPLYENPKKGFTSRFLSFNSGARIEVMHTSQLNPEPHGPGIHCMGFTHLAIEVSNEVAVDQLTHDIKLDGWPVLDGPRRTGDGYYESVVLDPEGNRIELVATPKNFQPADSSRITFA
jgi:lactoylglutathione lyase